MEQKRAYPNQKKNQPRKGKSVGKPVEKTTGRPIGKPVEKQVEKQKDKSFKKSADKQKNQYQERPMDKLQEKSKDKSFEKSAGKTKGRPIGKSQGNMSEKPQGKFQGKPQEKLNRSASVKDKGRAYPKSQRTTHTKPQQTQNTTAQRTTAQRTTSQRTTYTRPQQTSYITSQQTTYTRPQRKNGKDSCPYSVLCGGCDYQGIAYEQQLKEKQQMLVKTLQEFAPVLPIVGMEDNFHYRNKTHAVYARKRDGSYICGVYEKNSHRVVNVEQCRIVNEKADAILITIRDLLKSFKIRVFNEDSGYGLLRHVLIRTGHETGQILVVLVLTSPILPSKNNFIHALLKAHPEITSVVLNVNDRQTSMVLGNRDIVLYGKGYIEDILCGKTFKISARSFYQVNPVQTKILYEKALQLAALEKHQTILDAYSGVGTIGILAADKVREAISVELNPEAVKDAIVNAKTNQIKNISFYQDDATDFITKAITEGEHFDTVFLDPPRTGSTEEFLKALLTLKPNRIIYISCNPVTLARDLRVLSGKQYQVTTICPVDMFPWTAHVETIVGLQRRDT